MIHGLLIGVIGVLWLMFAAVAGWQFFERHYALAAGAYIVAVLLANVGLYLIGVTS